MCYIITSPVGAVAKYCDENVCVSVCLSVCPRAYLRNHTGDLYLIFLCMLPVAVARSSSGRVTKSQGEGAILRGCPGHAKALAIFAAAVAAAFAAKGIIQAPITSSNRRDHSVC